MVKAFMEERRHWVRAKRVLSIEFRLIKRKGKDISGPWFLSTTEDMSIKGIAFFTNQEYRPGDILEIRVTMSGILDILKGHARVTRVEHKKMGAFFLIAVKVLDKDSKEKQEKALRGSRRVKKIFKKKNLIYHFSPLKLRN